MPNLSFNCPHCQKLLEVPEHLVGGTIACPGCRRSVTVPAALGVMDVSLRRSAPTGAKSKLLLWMGIVLVAALAVAAMWCIFGAFHGAGVREAPPPVPSPSPVPPPMKAKLAKVTLLGLTDKDDKAPVYNGTPKAVTVMTEPPNLKTEIKYGNDIQVPINAGSYPVVVTITDEKYIGSATGTLIIKPATATVTLEPASLKQVHDGKAKVVTAMIVPAGLPLAFTYDGKPGAPMATGTYAVATTITDKNYIGGTTGTLVIALRPPVQVYFWPWQGIVSQPKPPRRVECPTLFSASLPMDGLPENATFLITARLTQHMNFAGNSNTPKIVLEPKLPGFEFEGGETFFPCQKPVLKIDIAKSHLENRFDDFTGPEFVTLSGEKGILRLDFGNCAYNKALAYLAITKITVFDPASPTPDVPVAVVWTSPVLITARPEDRYSACPGLPLRRGVFCFEQGHDGLPPLSKDARVPAPFELKRDYAGKVVGVCITAQGIDAATEKAEATVAAATRLERETDASQPLRRKTKSDDNYGWGAQERKRREAVNAELERMVRMPIPVFAGGGVIARITIQASLDLKQ